MAQSIRKELAKPGDLVADPIGAGWTTLAQSWPRMQQLQWDALTAWQRSLATFTEDFWEQWACRYAGGIPIDA